MKKIALAAGVLLVVGSVALAQQQAGQASQPDSGKFQWARKSSDILDKKIETQDGKELGKVEDLVIGPDGRIQYLILGTGGFAGIGQDRFSVPWEKIRAGDKVDTLVADLPHEQVQKFTDGDQKSPGGLGGQRASSQTQQWKDKKVVSQNGEELGTVKNVYSDQNNQPKYLIVQAPNGKLHPVPTDMIQPAQGDQDRLQARFDRQTLENAPEFQVNPDQGKIQWEQGVRGYYDNARKQQ